MNFNIPVRNKKCNNNEQPVNPNPQKYKTMLCKHFSSPKGCSFGDKCQFAHGVDDLRTSNGTPMSNPQMQKMATQEKKSLNLQNYKIVKCKYWEKDHNCRYGSLCTFAHGDEELRTKSDNMIANQGQMGGFPNMGMGMGGFPQGNPYMMPPMDPMMMAMMMQPQDPNFNNPFMMESMKKDVNPNIGSPSQ